jgi:uncharacterized lipoprotein
MNAVLRGLICLLPIMLASCSYISKSSFSQNHDKTYLYARSIPPLKIPPGIANSSFHSDYPVSPRYYSIAAEDVSVEPPGLYR